MPTKLCSPLQLFKTSTDADHARKKQNKTPGPLYVNQPKDPQLLFLQGKKPITASNGNELIKRVHGCVNINGWKIRENRMNQHNSGGAFC